MQATVRKQGLSIAETAAASKFKGFQPEAERESRKADVKEGTLERICAIWHGFDMKSVGVGQPYDKIENALEKIAKQATASDVKGFSMLLQGFQDEDKIAEKAGAFLSVLVNLSRGRKYELHLEGLETAPDFLCELNTKTVIIHGNAGLSLGNSMGRGSITLHGDAGNFCGYGLRKGRIIVFGNAGENAGHEMRGGILRLTGNAESMLGSGMMRGKIIVDGFILGGEVGQHMSGGEIHVKRHFNSIGGMTGGKIYRDGKLIVDL